MESHNDDATMGSVTDSGPKSAIDADACDYVGDEQRLALRGRERERTYHGYRAGVYYYPNDPPEEARLDYQSGVLDFALDGKLHLAPLASPRTILDVGTGTGAWAILMGDAYPDAIVEATDLSPIQPTNVPQNVQFIIDDADEEDWAVAENYYDYIHTRVMMGCFEDFKSIIRKGFKYTKPGGWMESLECMHPPYCDDGTMPDDWPFKEWTETMNEAAMSAGRPLKIANKLKRWYTEIGFVDVQEKIIKIPINSWARDRHLKLLGKYWAENILAGLQGFSLALFSRVFGWNKTQIEVYLVKIRKSITDHNVHAYTKVHIVWGRKPDSSKGDAPPPVPDPVSVPPSLGSEIVPPVSDPVSVPLLLGNEIVPPVSARPATPLNGGFVQEGADIPLPSSPTTSLRRHSIEEPNNRRLSI